MKNLAIPLGSVIFLRLGVFERDLGGLGARVSEPFAKSWAK